MPDIYKGKITTDAAGTIMHPQTEASQIVDLQEAFNSYMTQWMEDHPQQMQVEITGESS